MSCKHCERSVCPRGRAAGVCAGHLPCERCGGPLDPESQKDRKSGLCGPCRPLFRAETAAREAARAVERAAYAAAHPNPYAGLSAERIADIVAGEDAQSARHFGGLDDE